jgi:heterodisulfide reductase subunit B
MKYAYFPGCSLHSTAQEYDVSLRAVCSKIKIELVEPKKWLCCGATSAHSLSKLLALSLPYQNFLEIKKTSLNEVVVPCAACFSRFKIAQFEIGDSKEIEKEIEEIIGKKLDNDLKIYHPLEIFSRSDILNIIKKKIKRNLSGLKVACYYGCLLTRPPKIMQFDECEYPQSMDSILENIGVESLDWSYKTECCGAAFSLTETDIVYKLCFEILEEAKAKGAEAISVACPLCQANLDMRQEEIEKKYKKEYRLPIFYFTQLVGLALGLSDKELGLRRHFVKPQDIILKYAGK